MDERNVNVIIGVTGSVATIKLSVLIDELFEKGLEKKSFQKLRMKQLTY